MESKNNADDNQIKLSEKDKATRDKVINGNIVKTILYIAGPLMIYQVMTQMFGILDMVMVAHLGKETVSAVAYIQQVSFMISSLGTALALGGGIIIARYYGSGNFERTKVFVNSLFAAVVLLGIVIIIVFVPFSREVLKFANAPDELIDVGNGYFRVEILALVLVFINNVYISFEKAKGSTKKILYLNMVVFSLKLTFAYIFIFVMGLGVVSVSVATLIAQSSITIFASIYMFSKNNPFRMDIRYIKFSKEVFAPIVKLSTPIFLEKFAFGFGKSFVNSLSINYGTTAVGALGVSNKMGGLSVSVPMAVQDAESSIVSQNIGNHNIDRAIETYKKTLIINSIIGIISTILMFTFMDFFAGIFSNGDIEFANEIKNVFKYEGWATLTLAINASCMGLFYGFGYTKLTLFINIMRIFVFRIPVVMFFVNFTNLGVSALGIAMFVSNFLVAGVALITSVYVIKDIRRQQKNNTVNYGI